MGSPCYASPIPMVTNIIVFPSHFRSPTPDGRVHQSTTSGCPSCQTGGKYNYTGGMLWYSVCGFATETLNNEEVNPNLDVL